MFLGHTSIHGNSKNTSTYSFTLCRTVCMLYLLKCRLSWHYTQTQRLHGKCIHKLTYSLVHHRNSCVKWEWCLLIYFYGKGFEAQNSVSTFYIWLTTKALNRGWENAGINSWLKRTLYTRCNHKAHKKPSAHEKKPSNRSRLITAQTRFK